jgi:DNA helicase II / ATP-dependent DNA helicase PcrA
VIFVALGGLQRTGGLPDKPEALLIYFADLHIHSKFSRATSKDGDLRRLAQWAALKGVRVITTGDFTHPAWRKEIKEMLVDAGDGLFRLGAQHVPPSLVDVPGGFGPQEVRFLLGVEISSIYKKNGATRKVHNLVYMPDFDAMDRFSARLDRIGNINSDGRPILGLGSRELLEISLETTTESFFVPAHIWTPWFSILGSRSGFDSVDECFDDLTPHVFALETGLSSDPEMNFRVSALDRFTLVSYSDTHSPSKLGRQVTVFRGQPGYRAIREGIRTGGSWARGLSPEELLQSCNGILEPAAAVEGSSFIGTIDFFPEEGKYHLDGHRKCGVRLEPEETDKLGGKCPVCGQPVTVGVMNRVVELSDREKGVVPEHAAPFWRMLPLDEVIGQALGVGPQSKKVHALYMDLLGKIGPELLVLWSYPLDKMGKFAPEIVVEAIRRARAGEVSIRAGFDGQYGSVTVFGEGERAHFSGQSAFLPTQSPVPRRPRGGGQPRARKKSVRENPEEPSDVHPSGLNDEQLAAVLALEMPVLVQAGPGTGKTRTLTRRIATLIENRTADPAEITAVTFTRKASQEMRERLFQMIPEEQGGKCWLGTFHQLGARILDLFGDGGSSAKRETVLDEDQALGMLREAIKSEGLNVAPAAVPSLFRQVSLLKQNLSEPDDSLADPILRRAYIAYQARLRQADALDLDDLLVEPVKLLREHPDSCRQIADACARHLLVDEFQDVNRAQYEMVRLLASQDGKGLFVIGDPDQAIYGFRGADRRFFFQFAEDYPSCYKVSLVRNYRSQANVLTAAEQVLDEANRVDRLTAERPAKTRIKMVRLPNEATEAEFISRTIDALLGGASLFSIDSRKMTAQQPRQLGFGDFAVLYRLNAVGDALEKALRSSDIPFQRARRSTPQEEAEALDPRADAVSVMTIHASKGLEFPVVFIAGCEEGIVPFVRPEAEPISENDLEEERRLLYVAMTRARDELFLIRVARRMIHGRRIEGQWSRFVKKIEPSLCERLNPLDGSSTAKREKLKQYELFG